MKLTYGSIKLLLIGIVGMTFVVSCGGQLPPPEAMPVQPSVEQPLAVQELPDLEITDIQVNPNPVRVANQPAELMSGANYEFIVGVTNTGAGAVSGNVVVQFEYSCISECSAGLQGQSNLKAFVGSLGRGETKMSQPVSITPDARGRYRFWFEVDPDNIYLETNESAHSNVWETTLIVR